MNRSRADELDGLRAILALWVVACHMLSWCGFYEVSFSGHLQFFWSEFIGGASAVDTFMILSGFAISFLLNNRSQNYLEFMVGRFFRIYPVYFICLMLGLASTYLAPAILQTASWRSTIYFEFERIHYACERANMGWHLFWHLTLLNGLLPKQMLPDSTSTFLPPAWSITLEWQYYLIAPFAARLVRSGTGLLGLILVSLIGYHYRMPWQNGSLAFLPPQLPLFLIGIGSYHLYDWFCQSGQPRSRFFALPFAGVVGFAVLARWHLVALVIWAVAFGCIFVRGDDLISRLLSVVRGTLLHPWLQRLGRMSYCIYLIHWPLILVLLSLFLHGQPALASESMVLVLFFIGLPLILGASAILHEYIELPGMALGKRVARRREVLTKPGTL